MPKKTKKPKTYTRVVRYITATTRTKTRVVYERKSEKVRFQTPGELYRQINDIEARESQHRDPTDRRAKKRDYDSGFSFLDKDGYRIYTSQLIERILNELEIRDRPWGFRPGLISRIEKHLFDPATLRALACGDLTPDLLFACDSRMGPATRFFTADEFAPLRRALATRVATYIANMGSGLTASTRRNYQPEELSGDVDRAEIYKRRLAANRRVTPDV